MQRHQKPTKKEDKEERNEGSEEGKRGEKGNRDGADGWQRVRSKEPGYNYEVLSLPHHEIQASHVDPKADL